MVQISAAKEIEYLAELALRRQCEDDFYTFVKEAWPHIEGGKRFVGGMAVQAMCEHLEEVYYGRILRLNINIPPRCTKSNCVSVLFPVWCWIKNAGLQILTISYLEKLAIRDNVKSRRLIKSEWFQRRWGSRITLSDDQSTKDRVDNMQGGYRVAVGLDSGITGDGGDIIILDDANNVKDQGDTALENALDVWQNIIPTRFNDFKTGRLINLQQRANERDISGYIINHQQGEFVNLILAMEFESKLCCITVPTKSTGGKKWRDWRTKEGELLVPDRIGPRELASLKKALGSEYAIAGQLQQRPAPAEGGMVKRAWFKPWKDSRPPRCSFIIQSWDTAMSAKKEAAYSAASTWGIFKDDNGIDSMILLGAWRKKVEFPELYDQVQRMGRDYTALIKDSVIKAGNKPDLILVEEKASGHQILQTMNKTGLMLTAWNPDKYGDKTERVRKITHIIEGGRIYIPMRAPDFLHPLSYADVMVSSFAVFPKGESRDMVDTATQAIQRAINSGWIMHPTEQQAASDEAYRREREVGETAAFY